MTTSSCRTATLSLPCLAEPSHSSLCVVKQKRKRSPYPLRPSFSPYRWPNDPDSRICAKDVPGRPRRTPGNNSPLQNDSRPPQPVANRLRSHARLWTACGVAVQC